ncbi:hypothetical protein EV424DRAFT_1350874 [Suillus variegatus]|nr:hypothetical protein EV424DRAFT_1350874 [Suillus variegatus]
MSAPSSPYSESSVLSMEFEFVANPKVLKMLVTILIARHGILHYHSQTEELATFQWPTDEYGGYICDRLKRNSPVPSAKRALPSCASAAPSDAFLRTHKARFPALEAPYVTHPSIVQSNLTGICRGEYVAECATSTCGYMLNVEKFFGRTYVPSVYYRIRDHQPPHTHMLKKQNNCVDTGRGSAKPIHVKSNKSTMRWRDVNDLTKSGTLRML